MSPESLTQFLHSHFRKQTATLEFSLNGAELSLNSGNSENLRNHWSMNWVQYKDLLCYLCLCGLVVSSLSLTQEILGSSPTLPFLYFIIFFCHWIQRIQWKHLEKTPMSLNAHGCPSLNIDFSSYTKPFANPVKPQTASQTDVGR